MVKNWLVAGMAGIAVLAACSSPEGATAQAQHSGAAPAAGAAAARHPVSGLEVIDLVIERGGRKIPFKVELAASPEAQARGLMFRTELGDYEGMIFPSGTPQPRSFWMKNTPLSLDIIFIGPDGRIINIAADTVPYSLEPVRSNGPASGVLELRAGRARALRIVPGDKVSWNLQN